MIHSTKREVLVILVPGMIQPSGSVNFLMKWGCRGHWGHWGCWGCRGHWGCIGSKAWKSLLRTSVSSRFLNLALLWCFEKQNIWVESWNIMLNFSTLSVGGWWGQPLLLFLKLDYKTQISKPLEPTRHHNSIKLWNLLSLRADLLCILQYETPCTASKFQFRPT